MGFSRQEYWSGCHTLLQGVCVCVCVCVCVYIAHIIYHSSIDGHLGCFYILAITNNAAMNIKVHVSLQNKCFYSFLDRYPGVEFLDQVIC